MKTNRIVLLGMLLAGTAVAARSNILWITCEDISANIGCYGDEYARTPVLDQLAKDGVRYEKAYASAPVCSPARSCIITGMTSASLGSQHLRSRVERPPFVKCFTEYLREAGYYCTNNVKEDYQFKTPKAAWDDSSKTAHWRNRPEGKPFFSVFNLTMTHQSKTRYDRENLRKVNEALPEELRHDPAKVPVPPYYPDTPVVRENLAAYHTQITVMDSEVGRILGELKEDGLVDDTIVFYYSDHGAGFPRGKRWLHHSGIRVPFIIRFPEKFDSLASGEPGSVSDRLISFVDLAPTMLSLLGLPIPEHMQGTAFLGPKARAPRKFVFATRDRVDEVIQCSRTVVEGNYQYIRNFYPHRPRMPLSNFSERTPIRQEIRRLEAAGKLEGDAGWLAAKQIPSEELYDLTTDPHQMNNLAELMRYQEELREFRKRLTTRMREIRDTGLMPESGFQEHFPGAHLVEGARPQRVAEPSTLFESFHAMPRERYENILEAAMQVGRPKVDVDALVKGVADPDPLVRYWSTVALDVSGKRERGWGNLMDAVRDEHVYVQIAAADAFFLARDKKIAVRTLVGMLSSRNDAAVLEAAYALLYSGVDLTPFRKEIEEAKKGRSMYITWALGHL